jgi:arabinogalactan endo-1,4-beta-galactosidase
MKTGLQTIPEQHKAVYYNNQGQMQYGQQNINGHWYLFDKVTGAMKTGFQTIPEQHKTVYYNNQGQMVYGTQKINGKTYHFNPVTGAEQ